MVMGTRSGTTHSLAGFFLAPSRTQTQDLLFYLTPRHGIDQHLLLAWSSLQTLDMITREFHACFAMIFKINLKSKSIKAVGFGCEPHEASEHPVDELDMWCAPWTDIRWGHEWLTQRKKNLDLDRKITSITAQCKARDLPSNPLKEAGMFYAVSFKYHCNHDTLNHSSTGVSPHLNFG